MVVIYSIIGSVLGTLLANGCIILFCVWLKNKKGGN